MYEAVEKRVKQFFDSSGLTVAKLSRAIGVTERSLGNKLRGERKFGIDDLCRLLKEFPALSAEWLLRGDGCPEKLANPGLPDDAKLAQFYKNRYEYETEHLKLLLAERDREIRELECRLISKSQ